MVLTSEQPVGLSSLQPGPSQGDEEDDSFPLLPGFEAVGPPQFRRLVLSVWGSQKTGKSSFALRFPAPIYFLNLDFGIAELMIARPELWDKNKVQKKDLPMTEYTDPATWGPLLANFHKAYLAALQAADRAGGTVVVDTATQLWQIVQSVKVEHTRQEKIAKAEAKTYKSPVAKQEALERAEKPSQLDWGEANAFMGGLIRRAMHFQQVNAIFVNRAKPDYNEGGRPTGSWSFHGYGETPAIVQSTVHLFTEGAGKDTVHKMRLQDCRFSSEWNGFEMVVPEDPYGTLCGMLLGL